MNGRSGAHGRGLARTGLPISWALRLLVVSTTVFTLVKESTSCAVAGGAIEVTVCVDSWSLWGVWGMIGE